MIKHVIGWDAKQTSLLKKEWLAVESLADVEVTSEDPAHPVEAALSLNGGSGWRADRSGAQTVRLVFDRPQQIQHLHLEFHEHERHRTQEFVLRWSADGGRSYREIVRQQYNFSPPNTTDEQEDYAVELQGVTNLEFQIIPDISGGDARASLAQFSIA
jgi:hypothetical protein